MKTEKRKPYLYEAVFTVLSLILIMSVSLIVFGTDPHIPLLVGVAIAALVAVRIGYKWSEIEIGMINGVTQTLQAVIILMIIGVLIGVWILAGVVPTMIYYGLSILSPKIFLPASVIICSIVSLATGTSWGTVGTIGIALIGISIGLNIPAPVAAGAILSGAYFGDKISPLSDTTNLAPAMAGTDVFTHIKFMLSSTSIAYGITLIFFTVYGLGFGGEGTLDSVIEIKNGIDSIFTISPFLLIAPVLVITAIAFKVPAMPGIFVGIVAGAILAPIFQGASLGDILTAAYSGYESNSGIVSVDDLLSAGGLSNMMFSVSMAIIAMMFGGILETTGQMEVIVERLLKVVHSARGLIVLTVATCIGCNLVMAEQYISVVIPGRMYSSTYKKMGLHPKSLSNILEASGTVTGALVPWNTCGVFMAGILGVSTLEYMRWAVFNYTMPIVVIVLTFTYSKFVIAKVDESDTENIKN